MVQLAFAFVAATLVSVQASPIFQKRVAQITADSMTLWEGNCLKVTSNSLKCNPLAVAAFATLLAGADTCAQLNASDNLIDFAKQQPNSGQMIPLAQLFAQQPRNSPNKLFTPYCIKPPRNSELNGLYQCQYQTTGPGFAPGTPGDSADIPLGLSSVNPPGSCPANPNGPLPVTGTGGTVGTQLSDITTNPFASGSSGTPSSGSGTPTSSGSDGGTPTSSSSASGTTASSDPDSCDAPPATQSPGPSVQANDVVSPPPPTSTAGVSAPAASSTSTGFLLDNGQQAQKLNAQFATLTPDSSCSTGDEACINSSFAQCVGGKYVLEPCAPSLSCFALPLELKPGTSIACTTEADALQRIAGTGATGGLT